MKKTMIYALLLVSGLTMSCSLKEQSDSWSTRDSYYRNVQQIKSGLNGCYGPVRSIVNLQFFEMTECAADVMSLNASTAYDAICNVSPDRPSAGTNIWRNGYSGVMLCNEMLDVIDGAVKKSFISETEALPLRAEAAILRALYYYFLTSTFGDVPFYTCAVTEENRAEIARLPRMSADRTRDFLIDELMSYLLPVDKGGRNALPLVPSYRTDTDYRIGAMTGLMLAGKFCMWNQRWSDAVTVLSQIEKTYGALSQYPLSDIPFCRKYTPESIFEIGNDSQEYGLQMAGRIAYACTPTRSSVVVTKEDEETSSTDEVTDVYKGIAIPELGPYAYTAFGIRPTEWYYLNVLPYSGPDKRSGEYSDGSVSARGGSGNLAWRYKGYDPKDLTRQTPIVAFFSNVASGTDQPWLGNKFWCFGMYYNNDSNNYKIFRYAGALLNLAEAWLMRGDFEKACTYLNYTRTRAGLSAVSAAEFGGSEAALMEEIRLECARELFGEFQRKFDLVRWGVWYERTLANSREDGYLRQYIKPCHRFWPIPADQVSYSDNALDNNEYANSYEK